MKLYLYASPWNPTTVEHKDKDGTLLRSFQKEGNRAGIEEARVLADALETRGETVERVDLATDSWPHNGIRGEVALVGEKDDGRPFLMLGWDDPADITLELLEDGQPLGVDTLKVAELRFDQKVTAAREAADQKSEDQVTLAALQEVLVQDRDLDAAQTRSLQLALIRLVQGLKIFLLCASGLLAQAASTVTPKVELTLPGVNVDGWQRIGSNYTDVNQNFTDIDSQGPWFVAPCPTAGIGDFVYLDAGGNAEESDATNANTAIGAGIVFRVDNGPPRRCFCQTAGSRTGLVDDAGAPLQPSAPYYLSASVPGSITPTAPGLPIFVGHAKSSDELLLANIGGGGLAAGAVTISEQAFRARRVANQSIPASTLTTIIWSDEDFDPDGNHDPSTGIWTCAVDGKYRFEACVQFTGITASTIQTMRITKNQGLGDEENVGNGSAGEGAPKIPISGLFDLVAGDTVRVRVINNDVGARDFVGTGAGTFVYFSGSRVAPNPANQGESNTSSNEGAGGVGVVLPKVGLNLPFRSINVASPKLTVALDAPNDEVDLDLGSVALDDLSDVTITSLVDGQILEASAGSFVNTTPTKEVFYVRHDAGSSGDYAGLAIGANADGRLTFGIPFDFTTLVDLELVAIPAATDTGLDIDLNTDYAAAGEDAQTNTESDTTTTYSFTANLMTEIDISGVFSGIAAGDYCGIHVNHNAIGQTVVYLGVRLRYQ